MKLLLLENESIDNPMLVKTVDINDDSHLKDYYRYLNCRQIDMQEIIIDNNYYDIIFDSEFLLMGKPLPTLYVNEHTVIFNNVLFARHDDEGATIGLNDDDIQQICDWLGDNERKIRQWLYNIKIVSGRKY